MTSDICDIAPPRATLSLPEISVTAQERLAQAVAPLSAPRNPLRMADFRAAAKAIKVTLVLDPTAFVGLHVPEGRPRHVLPIDVAGRVIKADLSCKSIRKAVTVIGQHGADGVALLVQGQLEVGDKISSAGLSAMPKTPKPPQSSEVPAALVP